MLTAISAIFVFLMVILVHEFGHFAVAKFVGIRVNEFSIGMGPKIFQSKKGETQYTLRLLPIGGFVQMEGEDESSNDPRSFGKVPVMSRIAVVAAGAIMNFILAIVILAIVSYNTGMATNTIDSTVPNSPAEEVGLESGDTIIAINGKKTKTWESIVKEINNSNPEDEIDVLVLRNGQELSFRILPTTDEGRTIIGIYPHSERSITSAIRGGFQKTTMFLKMMFEFVAMLFKGQVSANDLSGPVGIIHGVGEAARTGFFDLLVLLAFISINLGFFNLLPIPALDGSRIIFLIIEIIRGKPINPDREGFIHLIGFVILISLMLIVTYNDIIRFNIFSR